MTKIVRLMGNEWKKEFSKLATWVMLIALCVAALSTSILTSMSSDTDGFLLFEESFEEDCKSEIEWYEKMLAEEKNDGDSIAYYRTEIEAYRIMLDAGMDYKDWRYECDLARLAAGEKYAGSEEAYLEWMDVIRSNDPKKYFSVMQKGYEKSFGTDPERIAIYREATEFCIAENVIPSHTADWRYTQVVILVDSREAALYQERLRDAGGAFSEELLEKSRNLAAVAKYRLENNVVLNPADSFSKYSNATNLLIDSTYVEVTGRFWDCAASSVSLLALVGLFSIVIAGTTISSEFAAGTIKFLLISPTKRWKILFSKYATVLLMALGMTAVVGVLSLAMASVFGISEVFLPAVYAAHGEVYTLSPFLILLREYGYELIEIVVMLTMAFSISALTRRSAMAIGLTVLATTLGSGVSMILQAMGIDAVRYLLFANLELKTIVEGTSVYSHQSVLVAVTVLILHMVVFLLAAHDAFVRRDI